MFRLPKYVFSECACRSQISIARRHATETEGGTLGDLSLLGDPVQEGGGGSGGLLDGDGAMTATALLTDEPLVLRCPCVAILLILLPSLQMMIMVVRCP
jgi:hypothetical protein